MIIGKYHSTTIEKNKRSRFYTGCLYNCCRLFFQVVHNIKFNSEIESVAANRRIVVVSFLEKLAAFDACDLTAKFTVTTCYPSPGIDKNPIALGNRWLAFADQRFVGIHR